MVGVCKFISTPTPLLSFAAKFLRHGFVVLKKVQQSNLISQMFSVNLLTFVRCSVWPFQVLSGQGETNESAGHVVDVVLSIRQRRLVSFENATAGIIEDFIDLA